ncbi:MAG: hypothetical protein WC867_02720 [Candidatus Pacearchaeota archaeon]|jgi:hypothetical protein
MSDIHRIKIYYPDKKSEEIIGIIDYNKKIIRIIEIIETSPNGYIEKGFINMDFIKKAEILDKKGCLGKNDGTNECFRK